MTIHFAQSRRLRWLAAGVLLLALLLLALLRQPESTPVSDAEVGQGTAIRPSAFTRSAGANPANDPATSQRPARIAHTRTQIADVTVLQQLLAQLPDTLTQPSEAQLQAVGEQVEFNFAGFLATLAGDELRVEAIRTRLEEALLEISQIAAARQANLLSAADLDVLTDPNHLLSRTAGLLEPEEITALEMQIQNAAQQEFLRNYTPQLEIIAPELEPANRDLLLETLFTERYALASPFGIGSQTGVGANLEQQMAALESTRDSLRKSMSLEQFAIADHFLQTQTEAMRTARGLFSDLR